MYHCERKIKIDFFFLSNKHRISEVIKSFSQEHCNRHIIQYNDYYQLHKIDAIENFNPEIFPVYDKKQKQVYYFNKEDFNYLDDTDATLKNLPDWEKDLYKLYQEFQNDFEGKRFIALQSKEDLNENRLIFDYCCQLENNQLGNLLLDSFNGRHAFRKFKNTLYQNHLLEDYEKYKYQAEKKLATNWCKEHNLI